MKAILTPLFFIIFSSLSYAQIKINGSTNVVTTSSNQEVTFVRKQVEITKTTVEDVSTSTTVIQNEIEDAKVSESNSGINVELDKPTRGKNSAGSKQIIIDLTQGQNNKQVVESNNKENESLSTETQNVVLENVISNEVKQETNEVACCTGGNKWALGIAGGPAFIQGDINAKIGYGGSFTLQKAFNRVFSLRYQGVFSETYGQDWKLKQGNSDFLNYKTRLSDHTIQGLVSLKPASSERVLFNLFGGAGFTTKHTWTNLLDANGNAYDYSSIPAPVDKGDKGDVLSAINDLQDNGYENIIAPNKLKATIGETEIKPSVVLGLGMAFKLSKCIDLTIEHRASWHNADNLDNYASGGNDIFHYTSLGFNVNLGKKKKAIWWTSNKKCDEPSSCKSTKGTEVTGDVNDEFVNTTVVEETTPTVNSYYDENNIIGYVFFDDNSSKINQEYYSELYKLKALLDENPDVKIALVGHADLSGTENNNPSIASERSASLYHFLTGIFKMDPNKFEVYAEGENNFNIPEGNKLFVSTKNQINRSVTLIIK